MPYVPSGSPDAGLSIGEVAGRTGVSIATLRAWEERYGLPRPARLGSGHRRFSEQDVEMIQRVLHERAAGFSLEAAIDRVRRGAAGQARSLFAAVRRSRPDLGPHVLTKRTMLAVSRAIEDECGAQAGGGVLSAFFQRDTFYRQSAARWQELARTASAVFVFADVTGSRWRAGRPAEVLLDASSPLRREWAVLCDAPAATACLVGVERPGQVRVADPARLFEAVWTTEPDVVRLGTRIALEHARAAQPDLVAIAEQVLGSDPVGPDQHPATAIARRTTALANRVISYLQPTVPAPLGKV